MKTILVLVAVAALFVAGCGGGSGGTFNVGEEFGKNIGTEAFCDEEGFEEMAGERETMYTCSFTYEGTNIVQCVFIDNSDFYIARHEAC